ncbi:hypothetical protein HKCCE3408_15650, partial [Rhodobacterales bacterium HKCCE3408]|nr:hypothetical protein [Rhodobacterales bacterium HKCCE3408]
MTAGFVPELDDIDFDALVEEARGLIPRFAPDWTDHNIHDPGITLIDLLAFATDQQIYRIGMVGPSLEAAFARLMGIRAKPAQAARFDIWPMPLNDPPPKVALSRFTVLRTSDLPDGRFLLDADVQGSGARIGDIVTVTNGVRRSLGTGLAEGRETLVLMPPDGGGPDMLELVLNGPVAPGILSLGVSIRGPAAPGRPAWATPEVEERLGGTWSRCAVEDRTHGLSRDGVLLVEMAGSDRLRLRLDRGLRAGPVTVARIGLDVLPAREGWLDDDETVVGRGTGLPDQVLDFETADILPEFLDRPDAMPGDLAEVLGLRSTTGSWQPVRDFAGSGPADRHVMIDPDAGTLRFGNGVNGALLPEGEQLIHAPLLRCAGRAGNIARGLRWTVAGTLWGENIAPASGGRTRERRDDLLARARATSGA